tara:strand:+ start:290 stop:493 length:204 start_codon:yes stop_codon:yes gene_type:complete
MPRTVPGKYKGGGGGRGVRQTIMFPEHYKLRTAHAYEGNYRVSEIFKKGLLSTLGMKNFSNVWKKIF